MRAAQILKMFALKQPAQLRQKLEQLQARASACACSLALHVAHAERPHAPQRDKKLGKITKASATQQASEILAALQKLGDEARDTHAFGCAWLCAPLT
jgi:hypothetical protein